MTLEEGRRKFDKMLKDSQTFPKIDTVAEYWIARALFEEANDVFDEVVFLYDLALKCNAEPTDFICQGLNAFMLRRRDALIEEEIKKYKQVVFEIIN